MARCGDGRPVASADPPGVGRSASGVRGASGDLLGASGDGGDDRDGVVLGDGRVEALLGTHVLVTDEDVDEAVQLPGIVEQPVGDPGVLLVERPEDPADVRGGHAHGRGTAGEREQRRGDADDRHGEVSGFQGCCGGGAGCGSGGVRVVRHHGRRAVPAGGYRRATGRPPAQDVPVSDRTVDRFAASTWSHRDFDAATLAADKRARGLTVSVVIPARDEEATVGRVAATFVDGLQREHGLVDEVLVVDADSTDGTAEAARAAGARVVRQADVLPEAGTAIGKGEALWKGLAATSGDLVCFVDADIVDVGPRFVVGLVGPLLAASEVSYVKATYDRPLHLGTEVQPDGGGRVTELLARPLIAAFWPELNWLSQPLSGEYAGRRSLLETLPFVRGYGVELAHLVDVVTTHGPQAIAQVDLGRRVHVHQPLDALGRMSAEILHVAVDRLARQGRLVLPEALATTLLQPVRDAAGDLQLTRHEVAPSERPPLRRWRDGSEPT